MNYILNNMRYEKMIILRMSSILIFVNAYNKQNKIANEFLH